MKIEINLDNTILQRFNSTDYAESETPVAAMLEDVIAFFELIRGARKEE